METSIQEQADVRIGVVNARLKYLAEATPKPVNYAYDPPAGVPRQSGKYAEQSVAVRNGREVLSELSIGPRIGRQTLISAKRFLSRRSASSGRRSRTRRGADLKL